MDNAQVVRDSIEFIWNRGELGRVEDFYTADFRCHAAGASIWEWGTGPAGVAGIVSEIRTTFPDYLESPQIVLVEGDLVAVRQTVTGTNTGPGRFAPTGKSFQVIDTMICRIDEGKLAEQWGLFDQYSLCIQLGLQAPIGD